MESDKPVITVIRKDGTQVIRSLETQRILGISWSLMMVGMVIGYELGCGVQQMAVESGHRHLTILPTLIALVWIYLRLSSSHDGKAAVDSKEKEKQ